MTGGSGGLAPRDSTVLSGVDTLVRLLLLRHELDQRDGLATATMVSGYPGSPLGTFDLTLDALGDAVKDEHRIVHQPGVNEELAAAIVWGSQLGTVVPYREGIDGVAGAWYGKGPGLDRSGDALRHANSLGAGPNGGAVLFTGDDPAAKSSTLTCDSQYTFQDACVPVLYPGDQQDVLDLGLHAFRMSRYSGAWTGLKIVTSVADGIGTVDLSPGRHAFRDPDAVIDGRPWRHVPQRTVGPHAVPDQEVLVADRRLRAAQAYARANGVDRVYGPERAELGIVCAGKTYFDVRDALGRDRARGAGSGAGVRILRLGMTFPLVEETIREFVGTVDEILVIEEKRPFIETQLRAILHEAGVPVPVLGKRDRAGHPLAPLAGELDAAAVGKIITQARPVMAPVCAPDKMAVSAIGRASGGPGGRPPAAALLPLIGPPSRSPGFCSGCPHNRSTVVPDGALVGGGVGCHGIMYFEPRHAGDKSLPPPPMGAEGVPWLGLAPFTDEPPTGNQHLIQNLGDGTLSHSGLLAIRAAVAAGADITFKILYNATVAMTGGQDVTGLLDVPALTRELEAEGVVRTVVCAEDPSRYGHRFSWRNRARWAPGVDVHPREEMGAVQEKLRGVRGVSVLIFDQRCAAELRRLRNRGALDKPPRRVVINEAVCEGCGDCGVKSNCLSVLPVSTEFGEKRQIHDPSCNRDYSCLEGDCPAFVTIEQHRPGGRLPWTPRARGNYPSSRTPRASLALPAGTLPVPELPAPAPRRDIYFTGIGGTGVVTANRILAAAAEAAGLVVGGMDQTGLSQKAGAVVSHLHLARSSDDLGSATVDTADLYLSGDILQAASARHLAKIRPGETTVVVDRSVTPTAGMLQGGADAPSVADLETAIRDRAGSGAESCAGAEAGAPVVFVDAKHIAEAVFGDHLLANVLLLGAAFQAGGLPLSLADVDQAMERQGRSSKRNREAFEWGRWAVHDSAAVTAALTGAPESSRRDPYEPTSRAMTAAAGLVEGTPLTGETGLAGPVRDLVLRRTAQVIDYQSPALGRKFLALVAQAAARDCEAEGWRLTRAVIAAWFKLLTYKDEYEVARLHLAVDWAAEVGAGSEAGSSPGRVTYHLHPPVLRRLGMKHKLPMGAPYALAFRVLARMKRLRGTPLDVFGWDPDRRLERDLIAEFPGLLAAQPSYADAVALAESVLEIKGYAAVKEASVAAWRAGLTESESQSASTAEPAS